MNSVSPRISVIMPVYNGEKYIAGSVQSVLAQTFTNFELIIINDASTDKTLEVLRRFKDPRISIQTNEKNMGSAASRTKAIAQATSAYIALLDADDLAHPRRLEKQVRFLDNHP